MNKITLITNVHKLSVQNVRLYSHNLVRNFCDKKSKPDDEELPKVSEKQQKSTSRLNSLLKAMVDEDSKKPKIELALAQPTKKIAKLKKKQHEEVKAEKDNTDILKATKDVAEHIGGDVTRTESELLSKLLLHKNGEEGNTDSIPTNLSDLIVGMKIDRSKKSSEGPVTRAQHVRKNMGSPRQQLDKNNYQKYSKGHRRDSIAKIGGRVDLFNNENLGIFKPTAQPTGRESMLSVTEELHKRELKLAVMHPPENYFQKMILWTEQGKLWRFPIDNEQDLKEEENVYFAEHVFLDTHLEGWCPTKGPVRHFMELVCVGLSKNPYLSVQEKKNHIEWFRDYFKEKQDLLKEVGALQSDVSSQTKDTTKSLT